MQRKRWRAVRAYLRKLRPHNAQPPRVVRISEQRDPIHAPESPYKSRFGCYYSPAAREAFKRWVAEFNPRFPKLQGPAKPPRLTTP